MVTGRPQLPAGAESSALATISQSLRFHTSPHSFLAARQDDQNATSENSDQLAIRARILNRDVAVIISYIHCKEMLGVQESASLPLSVQRNIVPAQAGQRITASSFGILPAYKELMVDFFPQPNLLLLDAPRHKAHREAWGEHMAKVNRDSSATLREIAEGEISAWQLGDNFDLYDR